MRAMPPNGIWSSSKVRSGPPGMVSVAELTARFPHAGHVRTILCRPQRRAAPVSVHRAYLGVAGLQGDHARPGKRALSLIQYEHLPVIAALAGLPAVTADTLRRNLLISGLNLSACRGRVLCIGSTARVRITGPCAPCSRMEAALGQGGYNAMRGHGGWCATVLAEGDIAQGMPVTVQTES